MVNRYPTGLKPAPGCKQQPKNARLSFRRHLKPFFCLLIVGLGFSSLPATAQERTLRIVLLTGSVQLLDAERQPVSALVNQVVSTKRYPWVELGDKARLFLQLDDRLIQLQTPGVHRWADITRQPSGEALQPLQFLQTLLSPRIYTTRALARSSEGLTDDELFNGLWYSVVEASIREEPTVAPEDLLAAAAWYHQQGNRPRSAFILEQLDVATHQQNPFYHQLRNDALRGTSLTDIQKEVDSTRQTAALKPIPTRYRALLIGIDRYEHPAWQTLENPLRDITALREILVRDYRFRAADVMFLTNPGFNEIIDAFHHLRDVADENTHLLIYFAGHGYYPPDEEEGYWIPSDGGSPDDQRLFIPTSIVLSKMRAIKSRHTLLIADSCFSGSLIRTTRSAAMPSRYFQTLSRQRSRQIITSGGLEPVSDRGGGNHSAFARSLMGILEMPRSEPLSASELALELRKDIKNSGIPQTPDYGRLHLAEDESGEFFFVHRDQDLSVLTASIGPVIVEQRPPEEEEGWLKDLQLIDLDRRAMQVDGNERRMHFGPFYYLTILQYNRKADATLGLEKTIRVSSNLEGVGMRGTFRRTRDKQGYGLTFDLGQFTKQRHCSEVRDIPPSLELAYCDHDADQTRELGTTLSGSFYRLGFFSDYSLLAWRFFSFQMGGAAQLRHLALSEYLEMTDRHSTTLGICGNFGFSFNKSDWAVRTIFDFCATTFQLGGSLHDNDGPSTSDVRSVADIVFGMTAGHRF
jgi:hypothetical protein